LCVEHYPAADGLLEDIRAGCYLCCTE